MKDEDIQNLLGGFATGTLTESERELLFGAALHNQELFNALADEEALREFIADPASRRRLLQALQQPPEPGFAQHLTGWMRRPAIWAVAGSVMAALMVTVAIRQSRPPAMEMARSTAPAATPSSAEKTAELPAPSTSLQDAVRPQLAETRRPRRDAPRSERETTKPYVSTYTAPLVAQPISAPPSVSAPSTRNETVAAIGGAALTETKLKLAVLDFDSSPVAKEADAKSADVGKAASGLLKSKLDSSGYTIIDGKLVDKALQAQNLNGRRLDAPTAARFGRSLGADAVILGTVAPVQQSALNVKKAVGVLRPESMRSKVVAGQEEVQVTAQAINTQAASNLVMAFAQGEQIPGGGLAATVDQVASSLGRQIQQNARKIDGLVTDVNAAILTLNVGAKAGVKVGDRLEVRRDGKAIGRVVVSTVKDSFSVGAFEGSGPARIGDAVGAP